MTTNLRKVLPIPRVKPMRRRALRTDTLQPAPTTPAVIVQLLATLPLPRMSQPRVHIRRRRARHGVRGGRRSALARGAGVVVDGLAGGFRGGVWCEGRGCGGAAGGEGFGAELGGGVFGARDVAGLVLGFLLLALGFGGRGRGGRRTPFVVMGSEGATREPATGASVEMASALADMVGGVFWSLLRKGVWYELFEEGTEGERDESDT